MAAIRPLSILAAIGLTLLSTVGSASAYVIEALTSIPSAQGRDKTTLERAIRAAVDDVTTHAVGFTPTVVSLREAKLVGDRIYLFVLITDAAGEEELEALRAESDRPQPKATE
jgi:hypothetical protein